MTRRRAALAAAMAACVLVAAACFALACCGREGETGAGGQGSPPDPAGAGAGRASGTPASAGDGADAGVPGRDTSDLEVCRERGTLSSTRESPLGTVATWEVAAPLEECAASIVAQYRDAGEVSLEHDGYLDLLGRVWGCVVSHPDGWAEIAIVQDGGRNGWYGEDDGDAPSCTVSLVRMDGSAW